MYFLAATNNQGKIDRIKKLLVDTGYKAMTTMYMGITSIDVEEGSDIAENAEKKARAYLGQTSLPILGLDTAFFIPGEPYDPAKVRRNALEGRDERAMTPIEIARAMVDFYKGIAERRGGSVEAYFEDAFALVQSDGTVLREIGRRPVLLTDTIHGEINPSLPVRCLYVVKATGKYSHEQTPAEELLELQPYRDALLRLFKRARF